MNGFDAPEQTVEVSVTLTVTHEPNAMWLCQQYGTLDHPVVNTIDVTYPTPGGFIFRTVDGRSFELDMRQVFEAVIPAIPAEPAEPASEEEGGDDTVSGVDASDAAASMD